MERNQIIAIAHEILEGLGISYDNSNKEEKWGEYFETGLEYSLHIRNKDWTNILVSGLQIQLFFDGESGMETGYHIMRGANVENSIVKIEKIEQIIKAENSG